MRTRLLAMLMLFGLLLPVGAQQMSIEGFTRLKRPIWNRSKFKVDKIKALLDLATTEKGFEFTVNGGQPAEVEEGDGVITLKLPHKTTYLIVKHPTYGQLTWRVPVKYLKKKNRYTADLVAYDPTKENKLKNQWVVFDIDPKMSILKVDSTLSRIRTGSAEFFLPLGKHTYKVESPFYEEVVDSFELSDTVRTDITVRLQPVYSYLTVKVPWPGGLIYVDNALLTKGQNTSGRLMAGNHRLTMFWKGQCYYDSLIHVGPGEKKVLEVERKALYPRSVEKEALMVVVPKEVPADSALVAERDSIPHESVAKGVVMAPVTLHAPDGDTEIWIDREMMGTGEWEGRLPVGYHQVTTVKDGVEAKPTDLFVENDFPIELNLSVPHASYGMISVHCNVTGAEILVNNIPSGLTPKVIQQLDASRSYKITLRKEGYKTVDKVLRPKANEVVDLKMKLKKK